MTASIPSAPIKYAPKERLLFVPKENRTFIVPKNTYLVDRPVIPLRLDGTWKLDGSFKLNGKR